MVLSRQQQKAAFDHILDNILDCGDGSALKAALLAEGIKDILDLTTITLQIIYTVTYVPDPAVLNVHANVLRGDKGLLRMFREFIIYRHNIGTPLIDDWTSITEDDFSAFRISAICISTPLTNPATTRLSSGLPNANRPTFSPAELFPRGIKHDPTLFPTLKDERFNDTWHRSFSNQARAQDVNEVLIDTYNPTTQEDKALFEEKKKFLYAVLEARYLQTVEKSLSKSMKMTLMHKQCTRNLWNTISDLQKP